LSRHPRFFRHPEHSPVVPSNSSVVILTLNEVEGEGSLYFVFAFAFFLDPKVKASKKVAATFMVHFHPGIFCPQKPQNPRHS
jgi:hypothetical protein